MGATILSLLREAVPGLATLDSVLGPVLRYVRVSGVGIIAGQAPPRIHNIIARRYSKHGKVFSFDREPVERLAVLRDYALLLVSNAYLLDQEEPLDVEGFKRIGVLGYELDRLGAWYRYHRFKPWRLYRGRVCVGRVCEDIGWMIWVPTYHRRYILVLCDPESMNQVDNLVWAYISGEKRRRRALSITETKTTPLVIHNLG